MDISAYHRDKVVLAGISVTSIVTDIMADFKGIQCQVIIGGYHSSIHKITGYIADGKPINIDT